MQRISLVRSERDCSRDAGRGILVSEQENGQP